jgi:O-acetyl-ADP-ribose deacetylase (regulator of RNase III)
VSQGSVVNFTGDALVNAANTGCLGGGGVDGAVNDAGGYKLQEARWQLPVVEPPYVRCPTGQAVVTVGGDLSVDRVIHAVGPDYRGYDDEEEADHLLRSAYAAALACAKQHEVSTLAFALISAAIFRGRKSLLDVLRIAVRAVRENAYLGLHEVHLVAFTHAEVAALMQAAQAEAEAQTEAEAGPAAPLSQGDAAPDEGQGGPGDGTVEDTAPQSPDAGMPIPQGPSTQGE